MGILRKLQAKKNRRAAQRKVEAYEERHRITEASKRPARLLVETTFDAFVKEFGGQKISDLIDVRARMPRNADYIFPDHNIIAELKTLEGTFAGPNAARALHQVFIDVGEPATALMAALLGNAEMPPRAKALIRTRLRRGLESRIAEARKQLRQSKVMFGDKNTRSLIIFAMDRDPLFGHQTMLFHLATLMGANYADEHTDGVVYLNPNMPTKVNPEGMEYSGWYPFYRDEHINAELSDFVNLLGNRWLTYYAKTTGNKNPILELETFEDMAFVLGNRHAGRAR
jgi:hypothetical protein